MSGSDFVIQIHDNRIFVHTQDCFNRMTVAEASRAEYLKTYPNACHTCHATGEIRWTENGAPHGAGNWAMPMTGPCPDCYEQGRCPRCHTQHPDDWTEDDPKPCTSCNWDKVTSVPLPAVPECSCYNRDDVALFARNVRALNLPQIAQTELLAKPEPDYGKTELTDEDLERQDAVDNAVFDLLNELSPKPLEWDMSLIGPVRDRVQTVFQEHDICAPHDFYPYLANDYPQLAD